MPVIVVEKKALYGIVHQELLDNLENIISGEDINIDKYASKIRIIPFTSLGKENGILIGIKSDNIKVYHDDKETYIENVIIGIYNGNLSKNNKYKALIGLEILEYKGGRESEFFATIKG